MTKRKLGEKFLSVFFCICAILSFAFSAEAQSCVLKLTDASCPAGASTEVTLSVKNNPGISNGILFIRYDPELLSVDANGIIHGDIGARFEIIDVSIKPGVVTLGFVNAENVIGDGILFTVPFFVTADAYPTQTKIDIEVKELTGADDIPIETENVSSDFTVSEPTAIKLGDVNADGTVDITDAMLVFYHVAKKEILNTEQLSRGDMNGDRQVDISDAMAVFFLVARKSEGI